MLPLTPELPMTRTATFVVIATLFASSIHGQSLEKRIDARLDGAGLTRHIWGVAVTDLDGRLLYGRNADRMMIPASNTKLLVSAVASARLGPDFTVRTSLYGTGPVVDGVLQGNLVLYGRGDPTFSKRCYQVDTLAAGVCDADPSARFRTMAKQLRAKGVRAVAGDLVGDGSYFPDDMVHPSWEYYDLFWWYAAPVSGLGYNDNAVDIRITSRDSAGGTPTVTLSPDIGFASIDNRAEVVPRGTRRTFDVLRAADGMSYVASGVLPAGANPSTESAAVLDPNRFAAMALRHELLAAGIVVRGGVRSTTDSLAHQHARTTMPLAEVESRPLRDWIFPILNTSQNWFADMTLKQLGRQFGAAGTWDEGLRVQRRFLIDSMQIDSTQFAVTDGSGLASNNLVSPLAFTRLLSFMRRHPNYAMFSAALPLAGQPGSLRRRFAGTPVEGKVRAKTGSISRVNTLSGYVERADGRVLVFSVQANHHTLGSSRMIPAIDSMVAELGRR